MAAAIPYMSIPTCEFKISISRRRCAVDHEIGVRPCSLLETVNVIAQNIEIGVRGRGSCSQLWVEGLRRFEQVNGKTGEDYIRPFHLGGQAGELVDLLRAEVRLHITLKVPHQLRNGRHNGRAEQLLADSAHNDVLILGAAKRGVLADARHP